MNLKYITIILSLLFINSLSSKALADTPPNTVTCTPISKTGPKSFGIQCTNTPPDAFYCSITNNANPLAGIIFRIDTGQKVANKSAFAYSDNPGYNAQFINAVSLMPSPVGPMMHFYLEVVTHAANISITCAPGDGGRQSY